MNTYPVTEADEQLIGAAKAHVDKNYVTDKHFVGAAGRTKDGTILTGINLSGSPRGIDVCGEPQVLSQAVTEQHGELDTIVAIRRTEDGEFYVVAPCGKCRELILRYAHDALTIVPDASGNLRKVSAETLLPFRYKRLKK